MKSATSNAIARDSLLSSQFNQANDDELRHDILERQRTGTFEWKLRFPSSVQLNTVARPGSVDSSTSEMPAEELKVIDLPQYKPLPGRPNQSLAALQEWEGVVTAVENDLMRASMIDITAGGGGTEDIAEIPLSEISETDRSRIMPGAVFRWVIGYLRTASGTQMNTSVIYFRRAARRKDSAEVPRLIFDSDD
jgi:hypothetical protein